MRDKDQIKRRSTQSFYTDSLSITRETNLIIYSKLEIDFHYAYRILTNLQFPSKKRDLGT